MSTDVPRGGLRQALPLLLALAACVSAAFWTADGVGVWDKDTHSAWHHYEYLAEGFLQGGTSLSLRPDPRLLALADPYDPAANAGLKLWDASLYHGRYYLYFGPAPALLMIPWRLLTGHMPPQRLAVAGAAAADLCALALLLWGVRRRHLPRLSSPALAFILVVSFHASWLPVLLRRPAVWELPIAVGVAGLSWALYLLWRYHDSGGRTRWALLAGVALALMVGSRVTHLFTAVALSLLFLVPAAGGGRPRWRSLVAGIVLAAGGGALLLYNHARFGAWLEFGQSYQLWGKDYRGMHFFSAGFIPFNAATYFLSLPDFSPYFPFLHPYWPLSTPAGYMETEDIYGILFMMPVHASGIASCAWAVANRRVRGQAPLVVLVAGAIVASALSAAVLLSWGGACSRYTAELLGGSTVLSAIGLAVLFNPGSRAPRLARALAAAAGAWTVACVWLASAEYREEMRETNPSTYGALAHALDAPSAWWAGAHGVRYGPVLLGIRIPAGAPPGSTVLLASGRPQRVNFLLLEVDRQGRARLVLALNEHHVLETPPLDAPGGMLRVRVDAPWLYPPYDHPYWDSVPERESLRTLFAIGFAGGAVRIHSAHAADAFAFAPVVLGPDDALPGSPFVESLEAAR